MKPMVLLMALLAFLLPALGQAPEKPVLQGGDTIGLRAFTIVTPFSQGKEVRWREKLYIVNDGSSTRLFSGVGFGLSGRKGSGEKVVKGGGTGSGTSASPPIEKQFKKLEAKSIWCTNTLDWEARPTGGDKSDSIHAGVWDGEKLVLYSVPLVGRYFEEGSEEKR